MSMKSMLGAAGLTLAVACGGGGGSSVVFNGTIRGQTITPKEAVSANATVATPQGAADVAGIVLSNQTNTCSNAGANKEPKNSQYFVILLGVLNLQTAKITAPSKPDTFTVWDPVHGGSIPSSANVALVYSEVTDAQCHIQATTEAIGVTGQVRIKAIDNSAYSGEFDVTLTDGDGTGTSVPGRPTYRATGSFSAQACQSIGELIKTQRSTQCI
jgi:hypothetical protein